MEGCNIHHAGSLRLYSNGGGPSSFNGLSAIVNKKINAKMYPSGSVHMEKRINETNVLYFQKSATA
jgi:hypothetical protein